MFEREVQDKVFPFYNVTLKHNILYCAFFLLRHLHAVVLHDKCDYVCYDSSISYLFPRVANQVAACGGIFDFLWYFYLLKEISS